MSPVKAYLVVYNLASAAGWAYVLYICFVAYYAGNSATELWEKLNGPLTIVQTGALMEVVHALIGVVPSPVFTVAMQVSSRILLVWGITRPYVDAQAHWSLYQMCISWGLVEVPRYLFYVRAQFSGEMPYALFWLRYSLFMVLYPTGISGEWMQMLFSLKNSEISSPIWYRSTLVIMYVLYSLAGPFMILNMWGNRKSSFKKRNLGKVAPRPASGLQWPVTNPKTNERGSSKTNKTILSVAMGAADQKAQLKLDKVKNWRFGYAKQVENSVRVSLDSPAKALLMAKAGLNEARKQFTWVKGGQEVTFGEALKAAKEDGTFVTGHIIGGAWKTAKPVLEVPYGGKDPSQPYYKYKKNTDVLSDNDLLTQLNKWEKYGTVEATCAAQIRDVVKNQSQWLDLSDKYFVLLGATSAMGPLDMLLKYGANIIAIDIDREGVWKTLITKVRNSSGSIYFPIQTAKAGGKTQATMSDDELFKCAGANLFEQAPELCTWVKTVCPDKAVTVGNYTYLDGELHVRLSVACDAIIETLCNQRKSTSVAFLCTPTDVHVIPQEANQAMTANFNASPWWMKLISALPGSQLTPNARKPVVAASGTSFYYVDGLSVAQGPNYALAKRLQHWRAIVERENGHTVSSNIAPSTATKSVVSAALFAAAYGGFHLFKPMEVMYQETSNAVMCTLLLYDVVNPNAQANPNAAKLENPYELFKFGSFHGGVWRCGFTLDSIGEVSVLAYFANKYWFQVFMVLPLLASFVYWWVTGEPASFRILDNFSRQLQAMI